MSEVEVRPGIPVTVVAGYLGAGKTSLLNLLLAGDHGRRLAVLVNDLGAVNVDADTLIDHDGTTMSIQNGCVCCSLADSLGEALDRMVSLDPPPDQIVIEASGVADPTNVASYGQGWPGCRLDAVLVLADAETIRTRARDRFVGELVTRQLRRADLVLITKCDLVDDLTRIAVADWLRDLVGDHVPVIAHHGDHVDSGLLLEPDLAGARSAGPPPGATGHDDHDPLPVFDAITVDLAGPVPRATLEAALRDWPPAVLRVKGIVELESHEGGSFLAQRVGHRSSIEPTVSRPDAELVGRLVVLGPMGSLDADELRSSLR